MGCPERNRRVDPRVYQIGTLASLLIYGMGWLDFDVTPTRVVLLLGTALATQWIGDRITRSTVAFGSSARSALISGLSLCLLLRTNHAELAVLAAVVTIGSKFVHPRPRQAHLQSDQRRPRRDAAADRPGLGVARAVGRGRVLRLPHGLRRHRSS